MKWYRNLRTAVKLVSAFVIVAILLGIVGVLGLNNLGKMNTTVEDLYNYNLEPIKNLGQVQTQYQLIRIEVRDMNTVGRTVEENSQYKGRIDEYVKQIEELIAEYSSLTVLIPEEKEQLKLLAPLWEEYMERLDEVVQLNLDKADLNATEFTEFLKSSGFREAGDKVQVIIDRLISLNDEIADDAIKGASDLYNTSRITTVVIIVVAFLVSIAFGIVISQMIAGPLNRIVTLVGKVAKGDLSETADINSKDELGKLAVSINDMVMNLRKTVSGILISAESVAAASQQISASTEEIASGSMSQADASQNMNELFKELSLAINAVAHSAEQASELSNKTMDIAQDGGKIVRSSINGMTLVNEQMSRLQEDSNKIGEIIEVIDDIAEQTNLLALNAAIEAARAGDQGRGFAVVADEVRKLAERSSEATKQITKIIKGMQENTNQSAKSVEEGVVTSQKTGEAFELIITMVSDTAHKVAEIAAASEEQAAQSSEVMGSIESISAATQEAAASSEETASTAQSLAQLAVELNNSVASFKIS